MPLVKGDVIITSIQPGVSFNQQGGAIRETSVEFTVRGQGPFSKKFPTESFDSKQALAEITKFAEQVVDVMDFSG